MTATKPEVLIAHVVQQTRGSNGYTRLFWVARLDRVSADTRRHRPIPETQYGDRQIGSSYISRPTTHTRCSKG
jgi:hypothetical protein